MSDVITYKGNQYMFEMMIDYDEPVEMEGVMVGDMAIFRRIIDQVVITPRPRPKPRPTLDNVSRIFTELKKLINVPLPAYGNKRVMYVGFPQSGKSLVQFILLWQSCFVHEKGTIHLLMNRIDSILQNRARDYPDLCKKIKNICERLNIPDYQNYIFDYKPFPAYAQSETEADSVYTVYAAMCNKTQLTRVKELATESRKTLVFDEADIFIQKSDKPVSSLVEEICSEAERCIECTATPFSNFNEAGQVYDLVIPIPPKEEYRGYTSNKIRHHIVTQEEVDNLTTILDDIVQKDTGEYKNVTLVNVDTQTKSHEKVAEKILHHFGGKAIVHVMNSSSSSYSRPLSNLMNQIADSDDPRPVFIIAGMMASRAVTFRSSKENVKQAILTAMVYAPSGTANQTTLMQAQRIYGNYDSLCPVIDVYSTAGIDVTKSFRNNSAMTHSVKPSLVSRTCIEKVPVSVIKNRKFSQSDDSKFEKLECTEFKSQKKLIEFVSNKFNTYSHHGVVVTTQPQIAMVTVTGAGCTLADHRRSETTRQLKESLGYTGGQHMHTAWSPHRYLELFSVQHRINHPNYRIANYTCGDGDMSRSTVPCITWKQEYKDVNTWNDPDIMYIFKTTKGTWKAWLPQQMNKFRKIEH